MLEVLSLIDRSLMAVHIQAKDQEEVIRKLGRLLLEQRKVLPAYIEEVVKRESHFPTGLSTSDIKVALPHAGSKDVLSSALAIGVLERSVIFGRMGDLEQTLLVQVVFLLAVKDGASQMEALEGIAQLLKNDEFLHNAVTSSSIDELYRVTVEAICHSMPGEAKTSFLLDS